MDKAKFKTRQEIASELGICPRSLKRYLHKANVKLPKGLVSPHHQKVIIEMLGNKRKVSS